MTNSKIWSGIVSGRHFVFGFAVAAMAAGSLMLDGATMTAQAAKVARDHRSQPVVKDHRSSVRDYRTTPARGGVTVTSRPRKKIPCLGNLC